MAAGRAVCGASTVPQQPWLGGAGEVAGAGELVGLLGLLWKIQSQVVFDCVMQLQCFCLVLNSACYCIPAYL